MNNHLLVKMVRRGFPHIIALTSEMRADGVNKREKLTQFYRVLAFKYRQ